LSEKELEKMKELEAINDELNARNQMLSESLKRSQADYEKVKKGFNKADRLIGKMMDKLSLCQSQLLKYEIDIEDLAAELEGYEEREKASQVPDNDAK
jgi:chromosome segregation ATPase